MSDRVIPTWAALVTRHYGMIVTHTILTFYWGCQIDRQDTAFGRGWPIVCVIFGIALPLSIILGMFYRSHLRFARREDERMDRMRERAERRVVPLFGHHPTPRPRPRHPH